jgi:hypothetical protein
MVASFIYCGTGETPQAESRGGAAPTPRKASNLECKSTFPETCYTAIKVSHSDIFLILTGKKN